jgi:type IX secretion system PorP/SprF family membrane protein
MKKILLICVVLLPLFFGSKNACAQDPSFSQFNKIEHWYNPARAGVMDDDIKAGILYRRQWSSGLKGFRTNGFNVEWRAKSVPFALGLAIVDDKAGQASMKTFNAVLSGAYHLRIDRNSFASAGLQVGFVQRSISMDNLTWDAQFNGYQYDAAIDNKERQFSNSTGNRIDLGMGVTYYREKPFAVGGGYAFHHLGQDQTFLQNGKDRLPIRQVVTGFIEKDYKEFTGRLDVLIQRQRGAMEMVGFAKSEYRFGADSRYTKENNSSAIYAGCGYRWSSAVIPMIGFEWERRLDLTITYDIIVSGLSDVTTYSGGPEISLTYRYRTDKRIRIH